jgi:hypothetical protein
LGTAVRWQLVPDTVRAMAETMRRPFDANSFGRLVGTLSEPLRQLDDLSALAERALQRDTHATAELRARLHAGAIHPDAVCRLRSAIQPDPCHCPAGPGCRCRDSRTLLSPAATERDSEAADADEELLDQRALSSLLVAIARIHAGDAVEVRESALDVVLATAAAACTMADLVDAHRHGGKDLVAERMRQLAAGSGKPPAMQTMSGGMPSLPTPQLPTPALPGFGLPGIPGIPGFSDPDAPGAFLDELLGWLRKRKRWDPELWDPPFWFWREPLEYYDPRVIRFIACLLEIRRRLAARAAISPPARPAKAVWNDGITSITAGGACAGSQVVIRGMGLKVPGAVLILPFAQGCRPVAVPPSDWSNTRITLTLPPGVVSGAIGFADGAYVAAYDAWASQQNQLANDIESLWCYPPRGGIAWVPPFGECPPDIGINHLRAGSAIINAFTAAGAAVANVEPGGVVALAWSVQNAEHVQLERIGGNGPLLAGVSTLVDPGVSAWGLGPFTHTTTLKCVYRLTATGPCGAVFREVTIFASKRPRLAINGIEVTQSIQNAVNGLRLVDSKPTVVRVTVRHGLAGFGGNIVPAVKGRIRVRRAGMNSGWIDCANGSNPMAANPGGSITVPANPQRNNTNDTLNFLIPPGWCTQTVSYEVEVRVDAYGAIPGFAGHAESVKLYSGAFTFHVRRVMQLRYVRVSWAGSTPTPQVCFDTLRTAIPLLPTPTANILPLAGVGVQMPTANDDGRDDLLDDFDDRHNCSWWEAMWEWLGADCPDDDGAIWVLIPGVFYRGRAFDIPSNVCFTPPSNGPYAAHELSHCLDQEHVGVMCSNGQQATGGDPPGDWPNNAQLLDVPFDVTRNLALSLAGTGVFDVMTYCGTPNNTWPMPARWDRLWNQVG